MKIQLTSQNFAQEVMESDTPVLIDFYADWCMPCKMLSPVIDEIAQELTDVKVCKVNIEEEPELARQFQVASIPMLVVMKDGQVADSFVGVRPKDKILEMLSLPVESGKASLV